MHQIGVTELIISFNAIAELIMTKGLDNFLMDHSILYFHFTGIEDANNTYIWVTENKAENNVYAAWHQPHLLMAKYSNKSFSLKDLQNQPSCSLVNIQYKQALCVVCGV
jgi:hypothetical protein